ncbi:hypothetical protein [Pontibacter russatus]|uniref:hypothetical protein n=1 Tax=Pontibacter russatus TaxID=2694929 RepID=UPI00137A6D06|nr:hypothetical protein [Pontibacter russatus]
MAGIARKALALVLCLLCTAGWAQDISVGQNSGKDTVGRTAQESADTAQYRHPGNTGEIAYAMPREETEEARRRYWAEPADAPELVYKEGVSSPDNLRLLALQAKLDAKSYYKAKGVFWTTLGSTVLHPVAGLATGSVLSAVPPNTASDQNPNRYLMKDTVYQEAYQRQAHRRKAGRAAAGFGVGAVVLGILSFAAVGGI